MATAQRKTKPNVFRNPISMLRLEQARTRPLFITFEEKKREMGCTGKAPQRVNAQIEHMHC